LIQKTHAITLKQTVSHLTLTLSV